MQSRGGVLKKLKAGRDPKIAGWLAEPVWQAACRHVASADVVQAATKVGWDWWDVVHELERTRTVSISLQSGTTLTGHSRTCATVLTSSVADARSFIRTTSQKNQPDAPGYFKLEWSKQ